METSTATLIYEQPLNDQARICLRLEQLFSQAQAAVASTSPWHHRQGVETLLQILNVLDRPDLKSKLANALTQQGKRLSLLEAHPDVNKEKLQHLLHQLDALIDNIYQTRTPLGHSLRNNAFLAAIKQHMYAPGGACNYNTPAYQLWLEQTAAQRIAWLKQCYEEFDLVEKISTLLLKLIRENSIRRSRKAVKGFFQESINEQRSYELVRVSLSSCPYFYPEISIGKHRLSIRFLKLDTQSSERPQQTDHDINFLLEYC